MLFCWSVTTRCSARPSGRLLASFTFRTSSGGGKRRDPPSGSASPACSSPSLPSAQSSCWPLAVSLIGNWTHRCDLLHCLLLSLWLTLSHLTWPSTRPQVQALFRREYSEVVSVSAPTHQERSHFFRDLVLHQAAEAPHTHQQTQQHTLAPFGGDDESENHVSHNFTGGNSPPPPGRSWWALILHCWRL